MIHRIMFIPLPRDEWINVEPVTVWWCPRTAARPDLRTLLDPAERRRHDRYLRAEDKERFLLGVATTRLALAGLLGVAPEHVPLVRECADCDEPHGPPRVPDGPHLSVSHSGALVTVAVSPHAPLGIDVEERRRMTTDIASHVLAPGERADDERELLTYWTRKEALLKATKDGLRVPMTRLHVSAPDDPPRLLSWKDRPDLESRLTLHTLVPDEAHLASLALLDHPDQTSVTERDATDLLDRFKG